MTEHERVVAARLREYKAVLALPEFKYLPICHVCNTVNPEDGGCDGCLFYFGDESCLDGPHQHTGHTCLTREEQILQFDWLLSQCARNGYIPHM